MKWLQFAFVGGSFPRSPLRTNSARYLHHLQAPDVLNLNVGGVKYSLLQDDLRKFPSSTFHQFANDGGSENAYHTIDRDGAAFRFVQAFLVNGQLPRDAMGKHTLDKSTLSVIKKEAEYFHLDALARECRTVCTVPRKFSEAFERERERKYISAVRKCEPMVPLVYKPDNDTPLECALRDAWAPVCMMGSFLVGPKAIYNGSKYLRKYKLDEFLEAIYERIQPEEGVHTVDVGLDEIKDIVSVMLDEKAVDPTDFQLGDSRTTHLSRVVIHTAGASYTNEMSHNPAVHNASHVGTVIGTMVVDEDSGKSRYNKGKLQFHGGQLQVSCGNQTVDLTPDVVSSVCWSHPSFLVAMNRNCTYSMSPVTSGTRVSLIYDIYQSPSEQASEDERSFHRTGALNYPIMEIVNDKKQHVFRELDLLLKKNDSVTIGLLDSYESDGTTSVHLEQSDRILYDVLCEKYQVDIVAATVHSGFKDAHTAGLHSEYIVDQVVAGLPERRKFRWHTKDTLVVPHSLVDSHILDSETENFATCGCCEDFDTDTLYLVSGLRVKKRAT